MRLFNKVKQYVFAVATVLALGAMATTNIDASAKTITEPKQTTKQVTIIGNEVSIPDATNVKINKKKYTKGKIKKKVATTKYSTAARAYKSWTGSFTDYYDNNAVYNTEAHNNERKNYKWISTSDYTFRFLKAGVYTITYDTYSKTPNESTYTYTDDTYMQASKEYDFYWNGTADCYAQYEISADRKTAKVTPVLFKTQHVNTYKVVQTTEGLKTIVLGKSKQTNTVSSNGTKTTYKTTYKNRYLKGKSGKVKYTMNKNYSLTSAIAVTRDAAGNIQIAKANKNSKISYSAGVYTKTETHKEYILDANGKPTYEIDPATGKETSKYAKKEVVDATHKAKYKETDIYYGWKDKYTGDYTKYDLTSKTVYIHKEDENGSPMYQKNADGTNVVDENGRSIPVMEPVTATVITREYPQYEWINGTYSKVTVLEELLLMPEDLTADKKLCLYDKFDEWRYDVRSGAYKIDVDADVSNESYSNTIYYLDEKKSDWDYSNQWDEISKNGLSEYTWDSTQGKWVNNPEVARALYQTRYKGTWVKFDAATMDPDDCDYEKSTRYADYVVNADGSKTYTYYAYKYELDANGEKIENKNYNYTYFGHSTSGVATFKAK